MQPILLGFFCLLFVASANTIAKPKSTLRVRLTSAPNTLDWNLATTGSETAILQNVMRGLYSQDVTGFPKLDLAKNLSLSPDLKTLTLTLREDVKWTDSNKLNSSDFMFSFERLLNPKLNLGKIKSFTEVGIKAKGADVIEISLREPRANFLEVLTHTSTFPMRRDKPRETLGAYRITSQTASTIRLQATRAQAEIQNAVFEIIPNGLDAVNAFRNHRVDYLLQLEDSLMNSKILNGIPEPKPVESIHVVALLHVNPSRLLTHSAEQRRQIMDEIDAVKLVNRNPTTRIQAQSIIPPGIF